MAGTRVAAMFVTILVAATVVTVTMMTLVLQLRSGASEATTWGSLTVALAGAGAALTLVALVHLSLAAASDSLGNRAAAVAVWTRAWSEVAAGAPPPVVPAAERVAAAEAAAEVLQDLVGEGAESVRVGLAVTGVLRADLAVAARRGGTRMAAVEAMERLAWIAPLEALPLFVEAARGPERRTAHAALLGACKILARLPYGDAAVKDVAATIRDHAGSLRDADSARPFVAAAISAGGQNVAVLCAELLAAGSHEAVRAAALDALGAVQPPAAGDLVERALAYGLVGETAAAALRALARIGVVSPAGAAAVAAAANATHVGTRVQAAHALVGAPSRLALPVLWRLLGDPNYEVRLATATALVRLGPPGDDALRRAAASHEDAFARDIAAVTGSIPRPQPARPAPGVGA